MNDIQVSQLIDFKGNKNRKLKSCDTECLHFQRPVNPCTQLRCTSVILNSTEKYNVQCTCRKDTYYKNGHEAGKCGVPVPIGGGLTHEHTIEYKVPQTKLHSPCGEKNQG